MDFTVTVNECYQKLSVEGGAFCAAICDDGDDNSTRQSKVTYFAHSAQFTAFVYNDKVKQHCTPDNICYMYI